MDSIISVVRPYSVKKSKSFEVTMLVEFTPNELGIAFMSFPKPKVSSVHAGSRLLTLFFR